MAVLDQVSKAFTKVFGSRNDRLLKRYGEIADRVETLEADVRWVAATNRDLQQSLQSLEQTMLELEPVLRNLRRKPNSLIFGGGETEDLEPRGNRE